LATPLQVLLSGTTMAANGKLMQPTIVRQITDAGGRAQTVWFSPSDFTLWMPEDTTRAGSQGGATWVNLADGTTAAALPEGSYQISPFVANPKWDVTSDALIGVYQCEAGNCLPTGQTKSLSAAAVRNVRTGMRLAVTDTGGTLHRIFNEEYPLPIAVAGKTGTAEYCDDVALEANRCQFGAWPTHSWTLAFAPYEDPEVAIMAFEYNGGEGASVAGPVVGRLMEAYFELKAVDLAQAGG
jgi:penicillin-binding protein 2